MLFVWFIQTAIAGVPSKMPLPLDQGEELYRRLCAGCHGRLALGDGPAAASLQLTAPSLAGGRDLSHRGGDASVVLQGRGDMPGFGAVLGLDEARNILLWLDQLDPQTGQSRARRPPKLPPPAEQGGGKVDGKDVEAPAVPTNGGSPDEQDE